jgi:hypothetical protein
VKNIAVKSRGRAAAVFLLRKDIDSTRIWWNANIETTLSNFEFPTP